MVNVSLKICTPSKEILKIFVLELRDWKVYTECLSNYLNFYYLESVSPTSTSLCLTFSIIKMKMIMRSLKRGYYKS